GVLRPQAQAGLAAAMASVAPNHPLTRRGASVDVRPMTGVDDSLRSGVVGFLAVLQAIGIPVLLIACINLAGLLMARAAGRARELAVRMALGAGQGALTRLLVAGQVALTTLLLVGAGLFLRTLQTARTINPGFDPQGVHTARLDLTLLPDTEASGRAFYEQLVARLAAEPGVRSASLAASIPLRSLAPPTATVRAE